MVKRVSIIGIGAVGAIYAWRLSQHLGFPNVRVVVDQERLQRYQSGGIFLNGEKVDYNYVTPDERVDSADLVIIATKNHHLEVATEMIKGHVGEKTILLSLLNGIDSEQLLSEKFGAEKVLYGFTTALDSTRVGNKIDFSTEGIIYFGEKDNSKSPRVESLIELFNGAKIAYNNPENIERELWAKFMVNVSINTISAITRGTYGDCANIGAIKELIIKAQHEVITLAKAVGIEGLDTSYITKYQKIFASLEYEGKTSMLQDIEAGRMTENSAFCLRASQLARQYGVETPTVDLLGQILEGCEAVQQRLLKK
ncbi:MAG TPA: ketopantoate reductase family protein [Spirochaetales bacterium]|nr:ketopantoate reductase family protein [Spirochaetales bacterium]